jgi:hypothetical protein
MNNIPTLSLLSTLTVRPRSSEKHNWFDNELLRAACSPGYEHVAMWKEITFGYSLQHPSFARRKRCLSVTHSALPLPREARVASLRMPSLGSPTAFFYTHSHSAWFTPENSTFFLSAKLIFRKDYYRVEMQVNSWWKMHVVGYKYPSSIAHGSPRQIRPTTLAQRLAESY